MARTAAPTRTRATAAKPAARTTRTAATSKKTTRTAAPAKVARTAAPAKPTRGRAAATPAKPAATKKPTPARRQAAAPKKVAAPVAMGRETDELTGFQVGTDSYLTAQELMRGGADRQDIIDRMKGLLDGETRNGTEKPVANIVASTMRKMIARGFTVDSSFVLVPPAPRAKRTTRRTK